MEESTSSCGIRSSSCTRDTKSNIRIDEAALLHEIRGLRTILADIAASSGQLSGDSSDQNRLLVIATFIHKMTPAIWNACLSQMGEDRGKFFALELDPEEHPQLVGLYRKDAPPLGSVCPLTGALMPHAFSHQLAKEVARIHKDGGELTLVLFAVDGLPHSLPEKTALSHTPSENGALEAFFPSRYSSMHFYPFGAPLCASLRYSRSSY